MKLEIRVILVLMIITHFLCFEDVILADEKNDKPLDTVSDIPRLGRKALFQTQKYRDEGNWAESAKILQETLEKHPNQDHFLMRFHLGVSLDQAGQKEAALTQYQEAVRMEPRYAQGWLNLAELAYNIEKYDVAGEAFYQGFQHHDADQPKIDLLYYAAACHILAKDHAGASDILEDLVSGRYGTPKLEWYRALIAATIDMEDQARGQRAIGNLLADFPADPEAWYLAFQFAANYNDYRQAAIALTVTGYLRPLSRTESLTLGDVYTAIGVPAAASKYYEQAVVEEGTAEEYERLASAYLASYQSTEALSALRRALEKEPTVRLWSLLGDQHYIDEDYEESYKAYQKCAEIDTSYGRAYLMMGYCALELERYEIAVELLEKAAGYPEQEETAIALLKRIEYLNQ